MNDRYLMHYGVKGMKWGIRKDPVKPKQTGYINTRKGDRLTFEPVGYNKLIARLSKRYANEADKTTMYKIRNQEGKKVGDLHLYQESPTSTNISWLGVNKKYSGRGYGRAGMMYAEQFAKKHGSKKITAEVVGHTPEINHLVDSMGYIRLSQISDTDDVWGGLTAIEKKLK